MVGDSQRNTNRGAIALPQSPISGNSNASASSASTPVSPRAGLTRQQTTAASSAAASSASDAASNQNRTRAVGAPTATAAVVENKPSPSSTPLTQSQGAPVPPHFHHIDIYGGTLSFVCYDPGTDACVSGAIPSDSARHFEAAK